MTQAPIFDPSMLGQTRYPRTELDFYPTPSRATEAFLSVAQPWYEGRVVAEPACGNGAISRVFTAAGITMVNTDIRAYAGFDHDALVDFLNVPDYATYCGHVPHRPTAIVTNPPYGDLAEAFAWKALRLMEECRGSVAMLCRHEWDAAKGRGPLFDHPSFSAKVTLRFRPRWIEGTTGAPRFSYAWFCWDWARQPGPAACLYAN